MTVVALDTAAAVRRHLLNLIVDLRIRHSIAGSAVLCLVDCGTPLPLAAVLVLLLFLFDDLFCVIVGRPYFVLVHRRRVAGFLIRVVFLSGHDFVYVCGALLAVLGSDVCVPENLPLTLRRPFLPLSSELLPVLRAS
jgi:hypothetical protein